MRNRTAYSSLVLAAMLAACSAPVDATAPAVSEGATAVPFASPITSARLIQGLEGFTLVAGKSTALRIYASQSVIDAAAALDVKVVRPDGGHVDLHVTDIAKLAANDLGPSVVARIPGSALPFVGDYYVRARLADGGAQTLGVTTASGSFLPTKDLRVLVDKIWSGHDTQPGEIEAAQAAMNRLAQLYPVRDGIAGFDGPRTAGVRYVLNDNPLPQDTHLPAFWDKWTNRGAGLDSGDVGIAYRFSNEGDNWQWGGNAPHYYKSFPYAVIVWGDIHHPDSDLSNVFCQETAHSFGVEPANDPHLDPGHQQAHSKDEKIDSTDSDHGFDVGFNEAWPTPIHDLMFWSGGDPANHISFNSWDWEYMRQQLVSRLTSSTGPADPMLAWQSWGGNVRNVLATARNANGLADVFVIGTNNVLYAQTEGAPGSWFSLDGHDLAGPVRAVKRGDGRITVLVRGADHRIYVRAQSAPNGAFGPWANAGLEQVKSFDVTDSPDGRLVIGAVFDDGTVHAKYDTWGAWANLGGHDLAGAIALGKNSDGRTSLYAIGSDGVIYNQSETSPNSNAWSGWGNLYDASQPAAREVHVATDGAGRQYVFALRTNGSIAYRRQAAANGGFGATVQLWGASLQDGFTAATNADGRVEVMVVGSDAKVYTRYQVNLDDADNFANWRGVGTSAQGGLVAAPHAGGELAVYALRTDGTVWQGTR